jgi:hypothetical protein
MKRKWAIFSIMAAVCWLITTSCATTTLNAVWKDPNYQGGKREKVLVVGVSKNPTQRRLFEDALVAQLKARGTDAVASYTIIPTEEMSDKAAVESKIKTMEVDTILVTKLVAKKTEKVSSAPAPYPPTYYYRGWYDYYSRSYGDEYEYEVTSLETNLYETETGKLIWSAFSDTYVGTASERDIKSFVKVIINSLSDNQLI